MSEPPTWASPSGSPAGSEPAAGGGAPPPQGPPPVSLGKEQVAPPPAWGQQQDGWGQQQDGWGQQQDGWGGAPSGWGGPTPYAPRPGVIPLRPLGLGELLDGSVSVVRRYPRPTLGLSAVVAAVTTLLNLGLVLLLLDELTAVSDDAAELGDAQIGGALVLGTASAVVGVLAGIVLTGIITSVVGKAVVGAPISTSEAWASTRPLLWRLLGLSLLTGLIVLAGPLVAVVVAVVLVQVGGDGTLLLGVPLLIGACVLAAWLYVRLSLAPAALVLERSGIRTSLRRSGELVTRSFWRVLGVLVLAGLITSVVTALLQVPVLLLGSAFGDTAEQLLGQVGAGIATALVAPFSAGVTALLYVDRRIRAEGLDVSLAAAAAQPGA